MLIKIAFLFLLVMAGLAFWGRTRLTRHRSAFCPDCGRPHIGDRPCVCGKGGWT